jgi:hypothetical protein
MGGSVLIYLRGVGTLIAYNSVIERSQTDPMYANTAARLNRGPCALLVGIFCLPELSCYGLL